ncbi:hypothetical protein B9Z19DRAFT_1090232 [Tuber borchii]|uniref:Uncharacterized protein n=1 Tax=Tuber borchii TaxID=42251 RepID=A0A2T6ZJ69_TUBBO|nr:hypothetical protein B9Z19DRAFT_1090232 [Tuber borchii]
MNTAIRKSEGVCLYACVNVLEYSTGIAAVVIIDTKSRFEFPNCGRTDAQRRLPVIPIKDHHHHPEKYFPSTQIQRSHPNPIRQGIEIRRMRKSGDQK